MTFDRNSVVTREMNHGRQHLAFSPEVELRSPSLVCQHTEHGGDLREDLIRLAIMSVRNATIALVVLRLCADNLLSSFLFLNFERIGSHETSISGWPVVGGRDWVFPIARASSYDGEQ